MCYIQGASDSSNLLLMSCSAYVFFAIFNGKFLILNALQ